MVSPVNALCWLCCKSRDNYSTGVISLASQADTALEVILDKISSERRERQEDRRQGRLLHLKFLGWPVSSYVTTFGLEFLTKVRADYKLLSYLTEIPLRGEQWDVAPVSLSGKKSMVFSNQQRGVQEGLPVLNLISTSGSSSLCNPTTSPSLFGSEQQTRKARLKIPEKHSEIWKIIWSSHGHQHSCLFYAVCGKCNIFFFKITLKAQQQNYVQPGKGLISGVTSGLTFPLAWSSIHICRELAQWETCFS